MGLREAMRKARDLLIETDSAEPAADPAGTSIDELLAATAGSRTVDQIVREGEGPNVDEIRITTPDTVPAGDPAAGVQPVPDLAAAGEITPPAIYQMAGLPDTPFGAEQMLEMLESLPQELPLDTKRQTVKVTLGALGKTVGATPETVAADAYRKMGALNAYVEHLSKQTTALSEAAEQEIAQLQAQIEEKRQRVQAARHQLATVTQLCEAESDRLDDVLEFFSLDVPPSKHAPAGANGGDK